MLTEWQQQQPFIYYQKRKEEYNHLKVLNEVLAVYINHKAKKIKHLSIGYNKIMIMCIKITKNQEKLNK